MRQEDTDALTHIADAMEAALTDFRQAIRAMDKVVDDSPVGYKGSPMSAEEINDLATVTGEMSRISSGLTGMVMDVDVIIGRAVLDGTEGSKS